MSDVVDAPLADITNSMNALSELEDGELSKMARQHGWEAPQTYNYEGYNAQLPQDRDGLAAARDNAGVKVAEFAAERDAEVRLAHNDDQKVHGDLYKVNVPEDWFASDAARYEYKGEFGDVGPAHPELERQLFSDVETNRQGKNVDILHNIPVTVDSEAKVKPVFAFADAGLHPVILENVEKCGYEKPTPIQAYCLPAIFENRDVIAVAQTGSGKTAAFLVPILSKLMGKAKKLAAPRPLVNAGYDVRVDGVRAEPLVLIIAPTRELSIQIFNEARKLCYRSMLRPCVVYGGGPTRGQIDELRKGCDILIGSPGRLCDFLNRTGLISFNRVRYTVLDEADEMVGGDWEGEIGRILDKADKNDDADHRYMLFSATFPKEARKLAKKYLDDDHIRIRVGRGGSTLSNIVQTVIEVEESLKNECLFDMLMSTPPARTMVFVNSKRAADMVDAFLYNRGMPSTSIHSDRTQKEREDALRAFKSGKAPILIATGVTARGLDIRNVMHVVNYDLPNYDHGGIAEYVHRIGRTARIGNDGIATSYYNDHNSDLAPDLVKILLESQQTVPSFLESFKPGDGEALDFEDDSESEKEEEVAGESAGGGWGAAAATTDETKAGGWGAPEVKDQQSQQATKDVVEEAAANNDAWSVR